MPYRYLSDCHVHSECSPDAFDPVMLLCETAAQQGYYALTVTDHCECNQYLSDGYDHSIRQSFFEARKAGAAFSGRLRVYAGVELGQPVQDLDAAEQVLRTCDFDFILASVHNVQGMPDFYELDYKTADVPRILEHYYDEVLETIAWGKFDSLAHLTYPFRYIVGEHKLPVDEQRYALRADEVFRALIKAGKALELNTSGLRQSLGDTMPGARLIARYRELGGRLITLGSDAHRWPDVGGGVEQGFCLLKSVGFTHFTVYVNHEPQFLPLE